MVLPDEEGENVNEVPRLLKLLKKTGYEIVQNNGQRVFGPPPDWSGSPPRKGSEVFVGKLPRDCYEDELVPFMEKIGKVYETRLMMDFSGSNRGYAFVMYTNPEDASKAVKDLNNVEIRKGRAVGVVKSVDNCRLFIGGLPKNRKREEIFEAMSNLVEGVKSVILYNCVNDKNKSRGFAFVEFDSHRSAAMARRKMLSSKARLWGYEVAVDWAEPEIDVEDSIMSKVTVLYVRNLMMSTTEEKIKEMFKKAGDANVEKVKKIRDFAFVHFSVREAAEKAKNVMNGSSLDGSVLEVTWAKPINKNLYRIHKAMLRSNSEIKSGWPGAFATYSQYPGFLAAWNSSTAYGTENPNLPKRIIRGAGGFRAGRAILQTSNNPPVMMPLIPEAHNKDSCFCLDTANLSVSKEQPECCEEATRHMMYYKVAIPPYPINTANHEDTSRFHLVPSPNSNGFDQTVITAGHVLHRPLLMAPSGSAPNGIHPDVTVTYAVPPPAAYYFHAPNKIPAYETGTYCDGRFCIPEPSSAGVV